MLRLMTLLSRMPLHKPYKDVGAGGWVPQRRMRELAGITEVVRLLSEADAKREGILAEEFHEQGWVSVPAVAAGLRARGYEVDVYRDEHEEERIKLIAHPAVGAKRRKKDQLSFLGDVKPDHPLGPNG
jgi:hypothetical protein